MNNNNIKPIGYSTFPYFEKAKQVAPINKELILSASEYAEKFSNRKIKGVWEVIKEDQHKPWSNALFALTCGELYEHFTYVEGIIIAEGTSFPIHWGGLYDEENNVYIDVTLERKFIDQCEYHITDYLGGKQLEEYLHKKEFDSGELDEDGDVDDYSWIPQPLNDSNPKVTIFDEYKKEIEESEKLFQSQLATLVEK